MRRIILFAAVLISGISCGINVDLEKKCIIEGNLSGLEGEGWVYMTDKWNDFEVIDSTEYHDGTFRFEVIAEKPTMVFLHTGYYSELHSFFNDPGTITLSGSVDDVRKAQVTGTPMNDSCNALNKELEKNMAEPSMVRRFELCTELFSSELDENMGNAYSLHLIQLCETGMHPFVLLEYVDKLEPYLKDKAFTSELKNRLESLIPISAYLEESGIKPYFIDTEYPDANGNAVRLSEVVDNPKNKCIYIDFWATWCGPCRYSMKALRETYGKYHDKGFEVLAVSCDTDIEAWKKCIKDEGFEWINVIGEISSSGWKAYMVEAVPTSILIDCSTGLIVGRDLYGDMLDRKLEEIL